MSENLPATTVDHSLSLMKISDKLYKAGLYTHLKNDAQAFAIIQYGAELGVGPMTALQKINFVQGKPAIDGQLMLALAVQRGVRIEVLEETEQCCRIRFSREGYADYVSEFTENDAKSAGLLGKDNWRKYRRDMMYWRCVAKGVRRIAPDAIMGAYTPDELNATEVKATVIDTAVEVVNADTGEVTPVADERPASEKQIMYITKMAQSSKIPLELQERVHEWLTGQPKTMDAAKAFIDELKGCIDAAKDTPQTSSTGADTPAHVDPTAPVSSNVGDEIAELEKTLRAKHGITPEDFTHWMKLAGADEQYRNKLKGELARRDNPKKKEAAPQELQF